MLNLKNERTILNIIKFSPILFVLLVSFFTTQIYLVQREKDFSKDIELTKKKYLIDNKEKAKNQIKRISKFIIYEKNNSVKLLKQEIKNRVYEAYTIATNIYEKEKSNHTKEELFLIIKSVLESMSYKDQRGYFFTSDKKGRNLFSTFNKEFENKTFLDIKDKNGYQFVKKFVEVIKNKSENYDSYYWYKPNDNKNTYKKISFYKYFEPFDIIIGLGAYVDDFEANLKKELLSRIKSLEDNDKSYVFIFDEKGLTLTHYKDSLVGTNRFHVKNSLGEYVVKNVIEFTLKNKEGFFTYKSNVNPENLKNREKTSYLKLIDKWNWIVGTGFYQEAFNKEIEEKTKKLLESRNESIRKILVFSIIITLFFILISFYVSNEISKRFYSYRNKIEEEVLNSIEKEKLLIQQSKMATMGEMIGNIAHQWKQPLSLISISNGHLKLHKELNILTDDDFYKCLGSIDDSVKNLSGTIDDFRNFFNPNKKREYFYLENAFEKTLKLINSQFKSNEIQIIKDIGHIEIYGFENELLQTFINILKNAKDELIKIDMDKKRLIFINAYKKEEQVIIKIKDNAGGIPNEIIDKIFDSYFTTKKDDEGTGIGLYMSKQILERMNASIDVKNVKYTFEKVTYEGAEFTIYLNEPVK